LINRRRKDTATLWDTHASLTSPEKIFLKKEKEKKKKRNEKRSEEQKKGKTPRRFLGCSTLTSKSKQGERREKREEKREKRREKREERREKREEKRENRREKKRGEKREERREEKRGMDILLRGQQLREQFLEGETFSFHLACFR
jgi:hypothetical protein